MCEPLAGAESPHIGRVPALQALGKLDPVTVIQVLATAE